MKETMYHEVYEQDQKLYTKKLASGSALFGEELVKVSGNEYRYFDPTRSKLAAAMKKKINGAVIKEGSVVLYLGAAHGYTASFISDMVKSNGIVFAVDHAYKVFRHLFHVSNNRLNVVPLYADAAKPGTYAKNICSVDIVYQDVAQKNQVEIFDRNFSLYADEKSIGLLVLKTRCTDVSGEPGKIAAAAKKELIGHGYTIIDGKSLDPFEKDHFFFVVTKKSTHAV